jgi:pyruvate/2-oxoglutarate dehydrogenase complex dihydrolipoamide acyltransferase (E2) component
MKKVTISLLSGVLLFGAVACGGAQTGANAPDTTENNAQAPQSGGTNSPATTDTAKAPEPEEAQANQKDASSDTRKRQLEADIRAREQRNNVTGGDADRADGDLESEVRSKLEANLPASALTVVAEEGTVTVSGTVPTQEQFAKIETLAKEIKGVKTVAVKATVAPAKPQ